MVYYYQKIGGDFMDYSIQAEYGSLLAREQFIRVQLNELPIGYISKKNDQGQSTILSSTPDRRKDDRRIYPSR